MILSDRTIREQLAAGRITIEPFDESCIQPSSVDVRLDHSFRVFLNHTMPVIDVKKDLGELTRLVEVDDGDAFILHPGEFVLASTLERVALPDDLVARVEGKALSLDTPVPTPAGWTTIGEIAVGDVVYSETGFPTRVKDISEVMLGRPCAEVLFSDGTVIVADEDHRWVTTTRRERRAALPASPRTTKQIGASLRDGRERNHHVSIAGSIQCSARDLAIHPYVLGLWLGDGTSTQITTADAEILDEIRGRGYGVDNASEPLAWLIGGAGHTRDAATGRSARNDSLSSALRSLGLLGNEHVPAEYLRASVQQRWWLLEGLMDSDGYCDKWGRCEYTTVKEHLAGQVHELVCSLGFRAVIAKKPAMLDGVDHGPKYEVTFTPDRPVFRLRRKLIRQRAVSNLQRFRAIADVRGVPSVPVRCIEVENASGIFLVGRTFIPTHNSSLGRLGLLIHSTAGFVDAGWDGHLTLELSNVANLPITLYPGMKIGQLSFMTMTTPADRPYGKGAQGSKYHGQRGPTPSRYFENFD